MIGFGRFDRRFTRFEVWTGGVGNAGTRGRGD
jgi:hypothetical protein